MTLNRYFQYYINIFYINLFYINLLNKYEFTLIGKKVVYLLLVLILYNKKILELLSLELLNETRRRK